MRPFNATTKKAQQVMRTMLNSALVAVMQTEPTANTNGRQCPTHQQHKTTPVASQKTFQHDSQQTPTLFQPRNSGRKKNTLKQPASSHSVTQRDQETTQAKQPNLFAVRRARDAQKALTLQRSTERRTKEGSMLTRQQCNLN